MTASDVAAWWGAGVATLVFAWEIFKWRRDRAALRVTVQANMKLVVGGRLAEEKHIHVSVANIGGQTTTVTHLLVAEYSSFAKRLIGRPTMQGAIPDPRPGKLPHVLQPGEVWSGLIDQADLEAKRGAGAHVYCGVHHSLSAKPVMKKVKL